MKRQIMKNLAFLLSIVMVISMFANLDFAVAATGDNVDITADNFGDYYVQDENLEYCYKAGADVTYGTIYVPEHYHLIVENVVTADTVILNNGARLDITGSGTLNFSGSGSGLQASDGALMMLQSRANKPGVITGLYDVIHNNETDQDEEIDIYENPGESEWSWMEFSYTASEGKWYVCPENGPEPGSLTVRYDGNDGGYVKWGEERINSDVPVSFFAPDSTEEQPSFKAINLTFHTPEGVDNTQILVRVNGKDFYDNGTPCTINDLGVKRPKESNLSARSLL